MNAYGLVYEEVSTTVLSGLMSSIKTGPTPFRMIYPIFFQTIVGFDKYIHGWRDETAQVGLTMYFEMSSE